MLFANCRLVNVWMEQTHPASIAVRGTRIVAIRPDFDGPVREVVDCTGRFVLPGKIELIPASAGAPLPAPTLAAAGITSVVLEGPEPSHATEWAELPVRVFVTGAGRYAAARPGVTFGVARPLHRYTVCSETSQAAAHLRNGVGVVLAQSAGGPPVHAILAALAAQGLDISRIMTKQLPLTAGAAEGSSPLAGAVPARDAQHATLNVATHFGIDHDIGSIVPGRRADFYIADTPDGPPQSIVFNGRLLSPADSLRHPNRQVALNEGLYRWTGSLSSQRPGDH
jgi:hypothetical protein